MSDAKEKDRATLERDRRVGDRGVWMPSPVRSLEQSSPKPDRLRQTLVRCRPEVAESTQMAVLARRSTEDVMRLYADSFLPDGAPGRPFPITYGPGPQDWERRTFPRCWLRANRPTLEEQLRRRFRTRERAREFERLNWYYEFIERHLGSSREGQESLRRLLRDAVNRHTFQQLQRDWPREAIDRLRRGLRSFAQGPVEGHAGSSSDEFAGYVSALWAYARVILNLADGGAGNVRVFNVQGAEEARATWSSALEDAHRRAILSPQGSVSSRLHGEIRSALVNEMRRQLRRVARKVGFSYWLGGRDVTEAKIQELADMI